MQGTLAPGGDLEARLIKGPKPPAHTVGIRIPKIGRLWFTRDEGDSRLLGSAQLVSRLTANHFDSKGRFVNQYDFGSGLTTQGLALALANEAVTSQYSSGHNMAPLSMLTVMGSGTGATAATAYDYELQDYQSPDVTGVTPTVAVSGDNATLTWTGQINYSTTSAITEWGLFTGAPGSIYSTSTNTFTTTAMTPGTSPAWTVNEYAGITVLQVAAGTSTIGFVTSNAATSATVSPGWVDQTSGGGAATTPSSNTATNLYYLMSDHKVFSAINVVSGDSISFSYVLTCNSGG